MEDDFLAGIGYNGVTARLKRLSDAFLYQTKDLYAEREVGVEPNWHMIFLLLEEHGRLTITEMATALGLSHPAIVKLTKKMKRKGYLKSVADRQDGRKVQIHLSDKARAELPELHRLWRVSDGVLADMMGQNTKLLEQLAVLEEKMAEADFRERMVRALEDNPDGN